MKKSIILSLLAVSALLASCEPVEKRQVLEGGITADQLVVSAVPQVRDGVNSNYIDLNSDGNACLSSWDYGFGTLVGTRGTVKVMMAGANTIVYSGLNADGSLIQKEITVNVDRLYDVEPEWALFCGDNGVKNWVWDDSVSGPWGNGGYKGNTGPGWWVVSLNDIDGQAAGEGRGASMTFTLKGAALTKNYNTGEQQSGSFTFDMSATTLDDGGNVWACGQITTKNVTVLCGKSPNEGIDVYTYDILKLSQSALHLAHPEPGAGSWGTAWFWVFKAQ